RSAPLQFRCALAARSGRSGRRGRGDDVRAAVAAVARTRRRRRPGSHPGSPASHAPASARGLPAGRPRPAPARGRAATARTRTARRTDALAQYHLRHAVFDAWLRAGMRPDAFALHARLLARALAAPGADGRATVAATLDDIAPFATLALDAGFGTAGGRVPIAIACGDRELRGALDGVHPSGVLRVVLNAGGLHGNHVVRHGLDWLCASMMGLRLHELAIPDKDEPPVFVVRKPLPPARAETILASLLALRDAALRAPLPFLPRSG